jgi:hypothetical protein
MQHINKLYKNFFKNGITYCQKLYDYKRDTLQTNKELDVSF